MAGMAVKSYYNGTADLPFGDYGSEMDASKNSNFEFDAASGVYKPRQVKRPEWRVSPTGEIWQAYGSDESGPTRGWSGTGQNMFGGGAMGALGAIAGGGAGGAGGEVGGPALIDYKPDEAADRAGRTDAKERAATRLAASMRGLDAAMSQRGIRGSGLQSKRATDLYARSAGEENDAELNALNQNAARRFDVTNRNQSSQNQYFDRQASAQSAAADRALRLQSQQQQLAMTLAQFGMQY